MPEEIKGNKPTSELVPIEGFKFVTPTMKWASCDKNKTTIVYRPMYPIYTNISSNRMAATYKRWMNRAFKVKLLGRIFYIEKPYWKWRRFVKALKNFRKDYNEWCNDMHK